MPCAIQVYIFIDGWVVHYGISGTCAMEISQKATWSSLLFMLFNKACRPSGHPWGAHDWYFIIQLLQLIWSSAAPSSHDDVIKWKY